MFESKGDVLMHPVRMRVVLALSARSGLAVQEIGTLLADVPQATLYRHITALADAGMLEVVGERTSGKTTERLYGLVQHATLLKPEDVAQASKEDHMRYFTAFAMTLMRHFGMYLSREKVDIASDVVGYRTYTLYLSDEELSEFLKKLSELILPLLEHKAAPERQRRTFSTVLIPDDSPEFPNEEIEQ